MSLFLLPTPLFLPDCSFTLGLLQSLIASVTLSLPDNSAVVLMRRLEGWPHPHMPGQSINLRMRN